MFWADIPNPVSHLEGDREFADSPLEGDGFEPSVPPNFFWLPRRSPQFTFCNINRLPRDRDRWFESISLHRRVCKLPVPLETNGRLAACELPHMQSI